MPSRRAFCKSQVLWNCSGREKSKRGSPLPVVPHSTKRKDKLERTISDGSGNTSTFSQLISLPSPWGKPSPKNLFPFKTIWITFPRMGITARCGTTTSYPYSWSEIGKSPIMVIFWSYLLVPPPYLILTIMQPQPEDSERATEQPFLQGHGMAGLQTRGQL